MAVLATLSSTHTSALQAGGASPASSLTGGYQLAFMIGAGLIVASIALAALVLLAPPWRDRSSGWRSPQVPGDKRAERRPQLR